MTLDTLVIEKAATDRRATSERPNAFRHGLTARRYVSEELAQQVQEIRQELIAIHEPESAEELQLVERLAIAQARQYETEAAWDERLRWQRTYAQQLFDRGESQRFEADLKAWRASPQAMRSVFGQTLHSAIYLKDLWNCIVDAIECEISISYEQVKEMILALGSDWRADRVDVARGRIMSAFLALEPEPRATLERWVNDSREGRDNLASFDDDLDRAHNFFIAAPTEEKARTFLKSVAAEQRKVAADLVEKAQSVYIRERDRCAEVTPGHPLGDASDVRETRLIRRYLTSAENRVDKIERRLLALRKGRALRDIRSAKPTPQPSAMNLAQLHEDQAMSVCSNGSKDISELPQDTNKKEDAAQLRNGAKETEAPASNPPGDRPTRRADPKKLAKSWREQAGKSRARPTRATIDPPVRV